MGNSGADACTINMSSKYGNHKVGEGCTVTFNYLLMDLLSSFFLM